jgi:cytochrome c oxidase cbb3-type subunit 4
LEAVIAYLQVLGTGTQVSAGGAFRMELDINTLRSLATVASFITFVGIVWWAWFAGNAFGFQ